MKFESVAWGFGGLVIGILLTTVFFALALALAPVTESPLDPLQNDQNNQPLNPLQTDTYSASIGIVAVQEGTNAGVTNTATVEIRPGPGRVLVGVNPFIEPDTQYSAETAANVAEILTRKDLSKFELIYSINSDARLVGGPSAGAALAVATVAAIEKKAVRNDAAITGTVEQDGTIGQIGGIVEKAEAVASAGKKLFLIPKGQGQLIYYEPQIVIERRGPFQIRRTAYVPKQLNLIEYAKQDLNLEIREVATVREASQLLIE